MWADIVLCQKNDTRLRITRDIRYNLDRVGAPREGEPVMRTKNAPAYGVFNGGIYTLLLYRPDDGLIGVEVDGKEVIIPFTSFGGVREFPTSGAKGAGETPAFRFGYCTTVHKAKAQNGHEFC
jgi:hypothetical protein